MARIERREFLRLLGYNLASLALLPAKADFYFKPPDPERFELIGFEEMDGNYLTDGMSILSIPLQSDYFYDFKRDVEYITPTKEQFFGLKNRYTVRTPDGYIQATILPHVTGEKELLIGVMEEVSFRELTSQAHFRRQPEVKALGSEVASSYTYSATVYPNKIMNILEGTREILAYQEANGPFQSEAQYSLLTLLNRLSNSRFRTGLNSGGQRVRGGGICAFASTLSKSLLLSKATYVERWLHPSHSQYFAGPGDPNISKANSDATVGIEQNGKMFDFAWQMPQGSGLYFFAYADILPLGETRVEEVGIEADARVILTLGWAKGRRGMSSSDIAELSDNYRLWRNGSDSQIQTYAERLVKFKAGGSWDRFSQTIFPEQRIDNFRKELASDGWLGQINTLRNLINQYADEISTDKYRNDPKLSVGEYLKQSDWYAAIPHTPLLEAGLRHLDWNTYRVKDQAVQCVGWVVLLAAMGASNSPESVSYLDFKNAIDLIPEEIIKGKLTKTAKQGLLFKVVEGIDEIDVSDLYITYKSGTAGHIGAVVGKKIVSGDTVLLLADANRKSDGRVCIFEVDKSNFEVVFGEAPYKKIIIRKI